jgi:hypothetical protein
MNDQQILTEFFAKYIKAIGYLDTTPFEILSQDRLNIAFGWGTASSLITTNEEDRIKITVAFSDFPYEGPHQDELRQKYPIFKTIFDWWLYKKKPVKWFYEKEEECL